MQAASLQRQNEPVGGSLPSPLFQSKSSPANSPQPANGERAPDRSPAVLNRPSHMQPHRAAAVVPYAAPAREPAAVPAPAPQPPRRQARPRQPLSVDVGQTDALAFDELWAGRTSAWDIPALRQGLVTQYNPGSPAAGERPGGSPVHVSASQDRMSDMGGSVGAAPESEEREDLAGSQVLRHSAAPVAAPVAGPPLLARAKQHSCEVPLWLPDSDGTVAAMGAFLPPLCRIASMHVARADPAPLAPA